MQEWGQRSEIDLPDIIRQKLLALSDKAASFRTFFAHPEAYRTSNQVDRLMHYPERILYAIQYFHGTIEAAEQSLRAMALIWSFHPYSRKVQAIEGYAQSPFEQLNRFRYHDHWLRNFLITSSLNGKNLAEGLRRSHDS